MKVLIVGCGAIGSVYAAKLSAVSEVFAFDAWKDHVDAINRSGLKLTNNGKDFIVPVKATTEASNLPLKTTWWACTRTRRSM